ncbi:MAG: hypothetical protein LBH86_07695 [Oscillospiraceae bacterium]|jgi:hypothetical protein|nr:hypothetical protein [Oscillospiraceae bacterium]
MNQKEHEGMMAVYVPAIIMAISRKLDIAEDMAIKLFYSSELYDLYADEGTKVWHYSPTCLANILAAELRTGVLELPEEA